MGRRARAASDFAGDLLKYLADFDFIKKQNVKDEAEDMAKYILMQRSQGKANLIDDFDMKQADDQFLYDFTPLHMNTQDRLQRASDARFEGPYIHGTDEKSLQTVRDSGFFGSDTAPVSESYIYDKHGTLYPFMVKMPENVVHIDNQGRRFNQINPFELDKNTGRTLDEVMSPDLKGGLLGRISNDYGASSTLEVPPKQLSHMTQKAMDEQEIIDTMYDNYTDYPEGAPYKNVGLPTETDALVEMMPASGRNVVKIDNIVDIGGGYVKLPTTEFRKRQAERRKPANNVIVTDGSRVRSPFARFDPEFRHLRNISASVVPASVGMAQLLQKPEVTKEEIEEYLSGLGS